MNRRDLDLMRFALHESPIIDTSALIRASGLPWVRGRAALDELLRLGEVTKLDAHHHDGEFCGCPKGGSPMTHWYLARD